MLHEELDQVFDNDQMLQFESDDNFRVDTKKYMKTDTDVMYVYYTGVGAKEGYLHTLEEFEELFKLLFQDVEADWLNMIGIAGASVIWKKIN